MNKTSVLHNDYIKRSKALWLNFWDAIYARNQRLVFCILVVLDQIIQQWQQHIFLSLWNRLYHELFVSWEEKERTWFSCSLTSLKQLFSVILERQGFCNLFIFDVVKIHYFFELFLHEALNNSICFCLYKVAFILNHIAGFTNCLWQNTIVSWVLVCHSQSLLSFR